MSFIVQSKITFFLLTKSIIKSSETIYFFSLMSLSHIEYFNWQIINNISWNKKYWRLWWWVHIGQASSDHIWWLHWSVSFHFLLRTFQNLVSSIFFSLRIRWIHSTTLTLQWIPWSQRYRWSKRWILFLMHLTIYL